MGKTVLDSGIKDILENETIIDIADSVREYYTIWFFTAFQSKLTCSGNGKSAENLSPMSQDPSQYLDGTGIYIQGSKWDGFANGKGDFTDGPNEIQNPEDFFEDDDFNNYGFNPAVGSVGRSVATTIRATMPPEGWKIPCLRNFPMVT
ncbi:hypothetical protein SLEP1_g10854 [Rubroshorea leprosula]|uniref:Uncharacterized protein n=1 Tax=Rubroshorea leprosula TaxID=152421 RepID=A0AAV5IHC4_9ROSI|nr:hypothetical protein SLEP1_g10854 [Rubroshorea leprosula]